MYPATVTLLTDDWYEGRHNNNRLLGVRRWQPTLMRGRHTSRKLDAQRVVLAEHSQARRDELGVSIARQSNCAVCKQVRLECRSSSGRAPTHQQTRPSAGFAVPTSRRLASPRCWQQGVLLVVAACTAGEESAALNCLHARAVPYHARQSRAALSVASVRGARRTPLQQMVAMLCRERLWYARRRGIRVAPPRHTHAHDYDIAYRSK